MIRRYCDICRKEITPPINEYTVVKISELTTKCDTYTDEWEICQDCEQAIRACIGNRKAKAERE